MLRIYNTETREKETIRPLDGKCVRMYTCGPTVYNFAHIGNFRTYVFEDLLRRTLKFAGMEVNQVMNLTDVEDKIIKAAKEKELSLEAFTQPYIDAFFEDLQALNIERIEHYPRATHFIDKMIAIIQKLISDGYAYKNAEESIYFSIDRFAKYGRLAHLNREERKEGNFHTIAVDEYDKENAADFALWKAYDPSRDGKIYWESPFGRGRPGWHIECSAMAMALLGESIDIHVGGVDNLFPHHENEIAQSEAFSGVRFVRHWIHAEHLLVDHRKMSKSLGNFYTLRDLLERGYSGREVRYLLLQTHYRTQLNFTFEGLDAARHSLQRLEDFIVRLQEIREEKSSKQVEELLKEQEKRFQEALFDDINISAALAALFDFVREINVLCDRSIVGKKEAELCLVLLKKWDGVLGVLFFKEREEEIPAYLNQLLETREEARMQRNWIRADECRIKILEGGYAIEDTPQGPRLKKKREGTSEKK